MENNIKESFEKLQSLALGAADMMSAFQKNVDDLKKDLSPDDAAKVEAEWAKLDIEKERAKIQKAINNLKKYK